MKREVSKGLFGYSLLSACCLLLASGCNKNPFDRTRDASNGGGTGAITGGSNFVIFNNELVSGGGAFEFPGSEGQSLIFNDTSNPISHRSIRYSWTGEPVAGQSIFAGFDLMHTALFSDYVSTPGRNLHQANYTKVTFFARGTLSSNTELKIEVSDDGKTPTPDPCLVLSTDGLDPNNLCDANGFDPFKMAPMQITSSWRQYTITVNNSALTSIKDFFKATFVFTPAIGAPTGQGGTAYFDVIQYQP